MKLGTLYFISLVKGTMKVDTKFLRNVAKTTMKQFTKSCGEVVCRHETVNNENCQPFHGLCNLDRELVKKRSPPQALWIGKAFHCSVVRMQDWWMTPNFC